MSVKSTTLEKIKKIRDFRIGKTAKNYPIFFRNGTPSTNGKKIFIPFPKSKEDDFYLDVVRHEADHIKEMLALSERLGDKNQTTAAAKKFIEKFFWKKAVEENPLLAWDVNNIVADNQIDEKAREELPGAKRIFEKERKKLLRKRLRMLLANDLDKFRELFVRKLLLKEAGEKVPKKWQDLLDRCVSYAKEAEGKGMEEGLLATQKIYDELKKNFDIRQKLARLPGIFGQKPDPKEQGFNIPQPPNTGYCERGENSGSSSKNREENEDNNNGENQKKDKKEDGEEKNDEGEEKNDGTDNEDGGGNTKEAPESPSEKPDQPDPKSDPSGKSPETPDQKPEKPPGKKPEPPKSTNTKGWLNPRVKKHPRLKTLEEKDKKVTDIVGKYLGEIEKLTRIFRTIKKERLLPRICKNGDEIDNEELIQAKLQKRFTGSQDDQIFIKYPKTKLGTAWAILADISSSTCDIINEIKATIFITGESLAKTHHQRHFGLYAFYSPEIGGGDTLIELKNFNEPYSVKSVGKILQLASRDGTGMYESINYLSGKLAKINTNLRGLIIISDGEPNNPQPVIRELERARKNQVIVIFIVIGREHKSSIEKLVEKYVMMDRNEISKLPKEIMDIFKKYNILN